MIFTHLALFSFFDGASIGETPTPPVVDDQPAGVPPQSHVREIIRLSDLENESRESTAEYIKSVLRKNRPDVQRKSVDKKYVAGRKGANDVAEIAMRNMEIERQNEVRRAIEDNNAIIAMIIAANS